MFLYNSGVKIIYNHSTTADHTLDWREFLPAARNMDVIVPCPFWTYCVVGLHQKRFVVGYAGTTVDWCCCTKLLQSSCCESTQICRTVEETQDVVVKSWQGNCRQGKRGSDEFTSYIYKAPNFWIWMRLIFYIICHSCHAQLCHNSMTSCSLSVCPPHAGNAPKLHCVLKKVYPLMFDNNFSKCGPIFKILLSPESWENSQCIHTKTSTSPVLCCYTTSWNSKIQKHYWFLQHPQQTVDTFPRTLWGLDLTFDSS